MASPPAPLILTLDIGSSSLRAMLFDAQARNLPAALVKIPYQLRTTPDGGAELDAEEMFARFVRALDELLARVGDDVASHIAAVATSSLAANLVGIDEDGTAITPVYTYADTRNAAQVNELASRVDVNALYARTGAPLHTSYWAPFFLWLAETQRDMFDKVERWMTLHEYFLFRLFGHALCSFSMASWTGMLDQTRMDWDEEWLRALGVSVTRSHLPELGDASDSLRGLRHEFAKRWSALANVPFFLAVGDGATSNLGCGATNPTRAALSVGTSGALRVVVNAEIEIPRGLWLYRVDKKHGLLGGSLSNGGNLFAWLETILHLPEMSSLESELAALEPDAHGLTFLPFLSGERSPGYRADARGALVGMSLSTRALDIVRAGLEAVAYQFARINDLFPPHQIQATIANGGALLASPTWVQIIADVLGHPVIASGEAEASSRGAALLALEALNIIRSAEDLPAALGATFQPDAKRNALYARARERQSELYDKIVRA